MQKSQQSDAESVASAAQNRRYKPFALVKKSAEEVVLMLDPRSFPSKKESELFKKEKDDNLYL